MKKYLEDLRQELVKRRLTDKEIEEIMTDLEEMIRTAIEEGLSEDEIRTKFGQPEHVAEDLADNDDNHLEPVEQRTTDDLELWKTYQVENDKIQVNVGLVSEGITYQLSDGRDIRVYYQGKGNVEEYEISYEKNEFRLSAPKKTGFHYSFNQADGLRFLVKLPKHASVEEFKHVTVSADIEVKNLIIDQMVIKTTSGDLDATNNQIKYVKLNSVSGNCSMNNSKIGEINLSQVSGDTKLKDVAVSGDFNFNTVSGDIELRNVTCNNFEVRAVSGDVDGKEFYPQKVVLKSVNGNIDIKNKENRYIQIVKKNTISGDISISR